MKRISAEPHPEGAGKDDPGNRYDTEQTFGEVLAHNQVFDRLCALSNTVAKEHR